MASKRKPKASSAKARGFTIVVEELRSQFKVFGEALQGLSETMSAQLVDLRETMDARFAEVDRRFAEVDRRFESVDRRFESVDRRFDRIDHDLSLVKDVLREHSRQHTETRRTLDVIHAKLDQKVDRSEVEHLLRRQE